MAGPWAVKCACALTLAVLLAVQLTSCSAAPARLLMQAGDAAAPLPATAAPLPSPGTAASPTAAKKQKKHPGVNTTKKHKPVLQPADQGEAQCCNALKALPDWTSLGLDKSPLPFVIINTHGVALAKTKNKAEGDMCICAPPAPLPGTPQINSYDTLPVKVGVRGSNSLRDFSKTSFAVTIDAPTNTSSAKVPKGSMKFLGLPEGTEFVMYAPEGDHALIRNQLAFDIWRRMGSWAPWTQWAELFMIEKVAPLTYLQHYYGLMMGGEKIWPGKNRIDLKNGATDAERAGDGPWKAIPGSYIFRLEHGKPPNVPSFDTLKTQLPVLIDYPRKNVSQATLDALTRWYDAFETQLLKPGLGNFTGFAVRQSLIDFFLAGELVKGANDGYRGSTYWWKPEGGRLRMGPVWDSAKALGMCCGFPVEGYQNGGQSNGTSGGSAISADGWLFNICQDKGRCKIDPSMGISQWYQAMWKDPAFRCYTWQRYQQLRRDAWTNSWLESDIASTIPQINAAAARNYQKWAPAYITDKNPLQQPTWAAEFNSSVTYLQNWIEQRWAWMEAEIATEAAAPEGTPDQVPSVCAKFLGNETGSQDATHASSLPDSGAAGDHPAGTDTPQPTTPTETVPSSG